MSDSPDSPLNYDDAVRELQEILSELQAGELGIDMLTPKLQRAGILLDFCQGKLTKTEAEVQAVLKRLGLEDAG